MKVLVTSTFLMAAVLMGIRTQAQNLGFGQAVLLTFSANTSPYQSPLYTVPAGKVWKIEGGGCFGVLTLAQVNGLSVNVNLTSSGTNSVAGNVPIWFPAGTTLKFYNGGSTGSTYGCYVSILEFTPTP